MTEILVYLQPDFCLCGQRLVQGQRSTFTFLSFGSYTIACIRIKRQPSPARPLAPPAAYLY
jgi:hypothetical protein